MSTWLLIRQNIIPEATAAILTFASGIEIREPFFVCWLFLFYSVLLRLVWNSSILIHGLGHTVAIAIVDRKPSNFNLTNIIEHRSVAEILRSLFPFHPIFIPFALDQSTPWLAAGDANQNRIRVKALGGIAANLLAIAWSSLTNSNIYDPNRLFIVANLIIAFCSLSDIDAAITGVADCFYCGNFGLVAKRHPEDGEVLLPDRMVEIAQKMGKETEIRGEQAGGGLVFARDRSGTLLVGKKVVNRKRENLTQSLEAAFAPVRKKAISSGIKPPQTFTIGVWHYRYATSGSAPSELETHWHEWMSARNAEVWEFTGTQWVCRSKNVNHRITHNGDFDAWKLFNREIDYATLGLWLQRVLHTPNATKGDSPKIAGMIDLLSTQGMWFASVRLAYQLAVATGIESAFGGEKPTHDAPNTAPSVEDLNIWAEMCDFIFSLDQTRFPEPGSAAFAEHLQRLEANIIEATSNCESMAQWSQLQRVAFVKTAIDAFFDNDLYRATQMFISGAKGSFGLVTASTLEPEQLVLSAKGQPISVGFNWQQGYMVYASEPAAVDRILSEVSDSSRLDLDQKTGEIALVGADQIKIYAIAQERELKASELESRWLSLKYHPYSSYLRSSETDNQDPVVSDINSIPHVLDKIRSLWQNPASLNRQSADYLIYLLSQKVKRFEQKQQKMFKAGLTSQLRQSTSVDLLITGEENSLWLGERFAQDLKIVFPFINVVTLSANQVLQQLNQSFSPLHLGKNSLILAITQSGQTFSTVQVINTFDYLCTQGVIGELFIMTGELSSFLNATEGNSKVTEVPLSTQIDNPHRRRVFVNGSGRRTTEPCTVSVAAAGQTLTELLLYIAKQMRKNFGNSHPFGMSLTEESLMVLEMIKDDFLDRTVVQIVGIDAGGVAIKSSIRQKLIKGGRHWALHITETPLVWAINALYILITVGWAIPFGYTIPLVNVCLTVIFAVTDLPQSLFASIAPVVMIADIAVYIFAPWLLTLLLRYCQGRQLFARTGQRTLVIGDVNWVNQLLQSYVSKLFSLSYGIASIEVHGGDPQNHFLHTFGHRVVRGTLVFLGVPDGRRSQKQQEAENAVMMTVKQANGIKHLKTGPEILVMGHNPAIAGKSFSHNIVLNSDDDSIYFRNITVAEQKNQIEQLRASCFSASERLIASYVFFWALARRVACFPLLKYEYWKSQSRTKIMTTASPVAGLSPTKLKARQTQFQHPVSKGSGKIH